MKSSNKANRSRRGTVGGALVGVFALALAACGGGGGGGSKAASTTVDLGGAPPVAGEVKAGALKGKTLTFVSYGGIYQDGQAKAAVEPFGVVSGEDPRGRPHRQRQAPRPGGVEERDVGRR